MSLPDVTIHRCKLHIVRRGGWSWGHDPRALTRAAIDGLPRLLAEKLIELNQGSEDIELTRPIRIRMRLKLADLYRLAQESGLAGPVGKAIGTHIVESIQTVLADHCHSSPPDTVGRILPAHPAAGANDSVTAPSPAQQTAASQPGRALLQLLSEWDSHDDLASRISTLPEDLLEQWIARLLETWKPPGSASDATHDTRVRSICERARELRVLLPPGRHRDLVRSVVLLVRLSIDAAVDRSRAEQLLTEYVPSSPAEAQSRRLPVRAAEAASPDRLPAEFTCDIPCALPFLMLVPLANVGYLSALNATLDAARTTAVAHAVGASLARKCLKVPERGWLRLAPEQAAAACFAGRGEAVTDTDVVSALYAMQAQWPLLDQFVAANLIAGHRSGAPWIIAHDVTGALVLFDSDGFFPVATGSVHQLAVLAAPSGSRVLMPAELAKGPVVDALTSLQIRHRVCDDGRCEEAVSSWNAILADRPALPRGTQLPGETSLALAASLALGSICWTLWRERESVHPLLAIERFHDFDARVHVTANAVQVQLPLGKRFWHLRDEGLLGNVSDVPWLPGRVVCFGAS